MSEWIAAYPNVAALIGGATAAAVIASIHAWITGARDRRRQEKADRAEAQFDRWVMDTHLCHACGGTGRVPREPAQGVSA